MTVEGRKVNCPSSLFHRLVQEYDNKDFSDVKLIVGKQEFYAHRVILACQSEVFRIMFNGSQWVESSQEEVALTESKPCAQVFSQFLNFFYSARIHLTVENIVPVRILADKYQHAQLLMQCDRYIGEVIRKDDIDTIISWLTSVANLGDKLERQCLRKLQLDFTRLMASENSRSQLSLDLLMKIISSNNVAVYDELMLFNMVATWIMERRHPSSQKSATGKLLPLIRFRHMNIDQLAQVESSTLGTRFPETIIKYMLDAYRSQAHGLKSKSKEEKKKEKEAETDLARLPESKKNLPMPRFYTEEPWGSSYTRALDGLLDKEYEFCTFSCPVVDRALKPHHICETVTKKTSSWDFNYKRGVKTLSQCEEQIMTQVQVTHELVCKYKITEDPRSYELVILTGYTPMESPEDAEAPFTTITTKHHYGTVKTVGQKAITRRKIKFREILKPALLAGSKYIFSLAVHYKE